MPSGRTACPHVTDNKDGTVTVKYSPTERGLHEMEIKYDGSHIPGNMSGVDRAMANTPQLVALLQKLLLLHPCICSALSS